MNSIDYFSPEELSALRGAAPNQAGGVSPNSQASTLAGNINNAYTQVKAQLAAQRGVVPPPVIPTNPTASAVPPSAPPPVAPAATAEATSGSSLGQRILNTRSWLSKAGGVAGSALFAAQAAKGAYQMATGSVPESAAYDNAFNGVAGTVSPALGVIGNMATGLRDTALSAWVNHKYATPSMAGPELQKQITDAGGLDNLLKQQSAGGVLPTASQASQVSQVSQAPQGIPTDPAITPLSGRQASAASNFIDSSAAPRAGTGFIRNENTGAVTQLSTPPQAPAQRVARSNGIFGDLQNFTNNYAQTALGVATANRAEKLRARDAQIALEDAKTRATLIQKPVVQQGLDGNPIVVNPQTQTAVKVTPRERPTVKQFLEAAKKDPRNSNFSDSQLEAEYAKLLNNGQL